MCKSILPTTIFFLCMLLSAVGIVNAQQIDSLQLHFDKLTWKDIKDNQNLSVATTVISGSRSEKTIGELPFTIYVITGEEIRQKGYLTLTDVLKRLPGIRVSQPGSGLEGETFLMRGLLGNTYAKILINDVPIKPFIVSGLPIGSQLPIRNAERIEVIYGPAATLYGADASAGVINIILKDSDRPVYAQADLGFGGDSFQNLDVMFGGKMGRGKRIFKFRIFGNFTSYNDRRIKYSNDSLYYPQIYETNLGAINYSYLDRPNYRGEPNGQATIGSLPHLSNALGIELNYRWWQFSLQQYTRRDHSSIGLSPYAVSYANPINYFGERIIHGHIKHSINRKRFRSSVSLNILHYNTDHRSSYSYVTPLLNLAYQNLININHPDPQDIDSLSRKVDQLYFSDDRFSKAFSDEVTLELLLGYKLNKHIELAGGMNAQVGVGRPIEDFSATPFDDDQSIIIDSLGNLNADIVNYLDLSAFLETYFNYKKWNIIIGLQMFNRQTDYNTSNLSNLNPRIAIQRRLNEKLSFRFSAGQSLRYPSPFYSSTSYSVDIQNIDSIDLGAMLSPEKTYSAELGSRWQPIPNFELDLSLFYTRTTNFIRYSAMFQGNDTTKIRLGYTNDQSSSAQLYGVQGSFKVKNLIPSIRLNSTLNINYSNGRESTNNLSFVGSEAFNVDLEDIRAQPRWIVQLDIEFQATKRFKILLENTFISKSLSRNFTLYQSPDIDPLDYTNSGYYTLDAAISHQFNKNLVGYMRVTNFFNKKYAGIDATENGNSLLYNPQSSRFIRFGVNYRLE